MKTLRQLVAGTDFSACAEQAIEVAVRLALSATRPARIALVHVCELGVDELDDEGRLLRSDEALAAVVARHRHSEVEVTGVLRSGTPWEKLDNVAADCGARLIVIGRHGRGRGPSAEIGSVAERLVRSANRPVLTVPFDFVRLDVEGHRINRH
jgi:nucleotide-binding universal stress UspA family protein